VHIKSDRWSLIAETDLSEEEAAAQSAY